MKKTLLAATAALILAAPIAAQAQDVPSYAAAPYANSEEDVHGRVVDFDGAYSLTVRDERGFIDTVRLHDGTIINPTGLTLAPGMVVNILGFDAGGYLAANEIDTPYTFYDGEPCYDGHVWSYWGPTVSLGFFFGNVGWWHGNYFGGDYAWRGGVRIYNNVNYRTVYRDNDRYGDRDGGYREPRPVPCDNHPGYHNPDVRRVPEAPIPLRASEEPSYRQHDAYPTQARSGYENTNRGGYQSQYRGNAEPQYRGNYQAQNRSNYQAQSRGNYQAQSRGNYGGHASSAPAHDSRPSGGHERH